MELNFKSFSKSITKLYHLMYCENHLLLLYFLMPCLISYFYQLFLLYCKIQKFKFVISNYYKYCWSFQTIVTFWQYTSNNSITNKIWTRLNKTSNPPIVSSILLYFLVFLIFVSLFENSSINLASNSFWADLNFGTATGSFYNNINYNYQNAILFFSKLVEERGE